MAAYSPLTLSQIAAVVVSHEHNDHVRGLGALSRSARLEVYLTEGTLRSLPPSVGTLERVRLFSRGNAFSIGDLSITPLPLPHDAADPTGFVFANGRSCLAFCTDLGVPTYLLRDRIKGCQAVILESNHDLQLLRTGPYPWPLKQRIKGRLGHLSNDQALSICEEIYHSDLHYLCFAHLSEVNNSPRLVTEGIGRLRQQQRWRAVTFLIAQQHTPLEALSV